jgi:hypothetical protein
MIETLKPDEMTGEVVSVLKQHEVVIHGEQKGIVYCFDGAENEDGPTFIVIQVRHCKGSPLLPIYTPEGILTWAPADDPYILNFSDYLMKTMEILTGKGWSTRIFPNLRDIKLVRYQAAVNQDDWREIWDTLLKPFEQQRFIYRQVYKTKTAPDIYFGVEAKPAEESPLDSGDDTVQRTELLATAIPPVRNLSSDTLPSTASLAPSHRYRTTSKEQVLESIGTERNGTGSNGTESNGTESNDGFRLPRAVEWLEFWKDTEIPQQRTFVDFAEHVNRSEYLRRARSAPQLLHRTDDNF